MDNQQETLRAKHIAYVGGLVDGEGCLGLFTYFRAARNSINVKPTVSLANTDRLLIDAYCTALSALSVPHWVTHMPARGRRQEYWTVIVTGLKRTARLLPHLIAGCKSRKRDNAIDMLAYCESRLAGSRKAPFTRQELELIDRVYSRASNKGHNANRPILRDFMRSTRSIKFMNRVEDQVQTTT